MKLKKEIDETKDGEEETIKVKELKIYYKKNKRKIGERNEHEYTITGIIKNHDEGRENNDKIIKLETKSDDDDRTLIHGVIILLTIIEENTIISMNMSDKIGKI